MRETRIHISVCILLACVQWLHSVSTGVKRLRRDVNDSLPSGTEIKNGWIYTSTPCVRLHGVDRVFLQWLQKYNSSNCWPYFVDILQWAWSFLVCRHRTRHIGDEFVLHSSRCDTHHKYKWGHNTSLSVLLFQIICIITVIRLHVVSFPVPSLSDRHRL
jgi:hypothetical protein